VELHPEKVHETLAPLPGADSCRRPDRGCAARPTAGIWHRHAVQNSETPQSAPFFAVQNSETPDRAPFFARCLPHHSPPRSPRHSPPHSRPHSPLGTFTTLFLRASFSQHKLQLGRTLLKMFRCKSGDEEWRNRDEAAGTYRLLSPLLFL